MNARHHPILTVVLTASLAASLGGFARPPVVTAADSPFLDIAGTTFEADIEWLWAEGITVGCTPYRFCPDDLVTRGQMASFLVRMFGLIEGASVDAFTDDDGTTHEQDINRLAHAGVTKGCAPTMFCPDGRVLRREMASFLVRAIPLTEGAGRNYFRDDDGTAQEADIDRAAAAGIASGCYQWAYCPSREVTRGEMAAFLHRTVKPVSPPPYPAPSGPQTLHVETDGSDAGNACLDEAAPCRTIRRALRVAVDGDTIAIGPGTFAEENLFVGKDLTIAGDPGGGTVIDASGGGRYRIFQVSKTVTLSHLTLTGGREFRGGAILNGGQLTIEDSVFTDNRAHYAGGAITSEMGVLTLRDSVFEGNEAGDYGGAVEARSPLTVIGSAFQGNRGYLGGAVFCQESSTIVDSMFEGNAATGERGGAIACFGDLGGFLISGSTITGNMAPHGAGLSFGGVATVANTTISKNVATDSGGGIDHVWGDLSIVNSTIGWNEAGRAGGGSASADDGVVRLFNALIAGNVAPSDRDVHGPITSKLASIVGVPAGLTLADILDPAGLQDNGGPTETIALTDSAKNPAIGTGDAATCAAAPVNGVDQRGEPRTPPCDIGAYELR